MKKRDSRKFYYKNHRSLFRYICYYCCNPGFTVDHVPAISRALHFQEKWLVRACAQCNHILHDRDLPTLGHRKAFIYDLVLLERSLQKTMVIEP